MDIQAFFHIGIFHGRLHFATLPDELGHYKPYPGLYYKHKKKQTYAPNDRPRVRYWEDLSLGYKCLHFDAWASTDTGSTLDFSVGYYYGVRYGFTYRGKVYVNGATEVKRLHIPTPVSILKSKLMDKRFAIESRRQHKERGRPATGLGALFLTLYAPKAHRNAGRYIAWSHYCNGRYDNGFLSHEYCMGIVQYLHLDCGSNNLILCQQEIGGELSKMPALFERHHNKTSWDEYP